jgi:excisionase family DNA binding protein
MANCTENARNRSESTYPSVAALAADIGLSERSTRSALRRGEIPHIRIGRRFILPKAAIADWLRSAGMGREECSGAASDKLQPLSPDPKRSQAGTTGRAEAPVAQFGSKR